MFSEMSFHYQDNSWQAVIGWRTFI